MNKTTFSSQHIVCLGGGIGTVNLIRGLKPMVSDITTVISMADEGGSSGRLRRLYNIFPPGDLVSCMAALADGDNEQVRKLLTYRFAGNRYGKDSDIGGHKLGNLLMVAMIDLTQNFEEAIALFQKIFRVKGTFLPATREHVSISAKTIEGQEIYGEERIDLGKYKGKRILEHVFLHPADAHAAHGVVDKILSADVVILGPGDLYTTVLPVLIVPEIAKAVKKTKAKKIFVINVANKPFETKGYSVYDYMHAVQKHIGFFPFDMVLVNNNFSTQIPQKFHYQYVKLPQTPFEIVTRIVQEDLIDEQFSLYHSTLKLANAIREHI